MISTEFHNQAKEPKGMVSELNQQSKVIRNTKSLNALRQVNGGKPTHEIYMQSNDITAYDPFDSYYSTPSIFMPKQYQSKKFQVFDTELPSSSPESSFSNLIDLELSSGTRTPSLKNEMDENNLHSSPPFMKDDDLYKTTSLSTPNFLYHNAIQRKGLYDQQMYGLDNYHTNSFFSMDEINQNDGSKDSNIVIQRLMNQLNLTNVDNEKKSTTIINLQNLLANKELELKDLNQQLVSANQLLEAQSKLLLGKLTEINLYQTFINSKGLNLPEINHSGETKLSPLESSEKSYKKLHNSNFNPPYHQTFYSQDDRCTLSSTSVNVLSDQKPSDKNMDWESMVDRIIKDTDQQASIYMQQKLKASPLADQKSLIIQAILKQAHGLITNRFGNFLVQRLFEVGSVEQIESLADTMRGHVVELTCHPFGCHVIQKAFDFIQEPTKADFTFELLSSIPDTIVHKNACHVWQKVFEIRWSRCSPPIMNHLNQALKGEWTRVALDETGSLVIQNIFENLAEEDKRPILDEILLNAITISKGQWGNWVIQHILEGAEKSSDREAAFDFVIRESIQLSMDQFGSKVVEKSLRIGGQAFIKRFIDHLCQTTHTSKSRMALVDIASDQYGNYVVQWLINTTEQDQKVNICRIIKRHMVSLRGSKYGQRVAYLVEKVLRGQSVITYPRNN